MTATNYKAAIRMFFFASQQYFRNSLLTGNGLSPGFSVNVRAGA